MIKEIDITKQLKAYQISPGYSSGVTHLDKKKQLMFEVNGPVKSSAGTETYTKSIPCY